MPLARPGHTAIHLRQQDNVAGRRTQEHRRGSDALASFGVPERDPGRFRRGGHDGRRPDFDLMEDREGSEQAVVIDVLSRAIGQEATLLRQRRGERARGGEDQAVAHGIVTRTSGRRGCDVRSKTKTSDGDRHAVGHPSLLRSPLQGRGVVPVSSRSCRAPPGPWARCR